MTAHFLWGSTSEKHTIHWKSWDKLCASKARGGLGFRDLKAFNLALLSKQVWRILTAPSSLLARILKAKYFPSCNIFDASLGNRPSWSWRSIFESIQYLKPGCTKIIKSGSSTLIWNDPWLPIYSDNRIRSTPPPHTPYRRVSDLIIQNMGCWNSELVRSLFSHEEARAILAMPLTLCDSADLWGWKFTKSGKFTVRSAYHAILESNNLQHTHTHSASSSSTGTSVWKKIWKLQITPRSQVFLWRCLSGSIATSDFLHIHHLHNSSPCTLCNSDNPTATHVFFHCPFAESVWRMSGIWESINKLQQPSFTLWTREILLEFNLDMCNLFATICNFIWFSRNKKKFENVEPNPYSVVLMANNSLTDYHSARKWPERPSSKLIVDCLLEKSPTGPRIFFDGAISYMGAGIGVALWDNSGNFLKGFSRKIPDISDAEVAESLALLEALNLARQFNLSLVEIYGDAAAIVLAANEDALFPASCSAIADDISAAKSQITIASISWIRRHKNFVAHFFASYAKHIQSVSYVWDSIPTTLCQSLLDDFQPL
ncbi:hypothetical protein DH2020_026281 [Rehmannia glutinosa]|uniref:Reverse transcriptase zinc-binding domain n=1 Tax=Rehmannia glutinosa TaxID=99300 RepID=A0ABR0VZV2_REHGL